jgi:hypothetical protein
MAVTHTETNRGQPAIVVDGILYRISNTLKSGDVGYRCTTKSCKMSITTNKKPEQSSLRINVLLVTCISYILPVFTCI